MNSNSSPAAPAWMRRCLVAAGIYNLVWGFAVICWPHFLFDLTNVERLNHPEVWQCVGMVVGVYGIGYLLAARDHRTHWPIVLVGFLGKVFGPMGFAWAWYQQRLPGTWGLVILFNDLIWLVPFGLILIDAARHHLGPNLARGRFVYESRIAAPPEEVFAFHEHPQALNWLIPPWESVTPIEPPKSLRTGSRVVLEGRLGPFRLRWVAVHTDYDPPHVFADIQESGPFAHWHHRHRFLDDGSGGTLLRDEVEYELPGGAVSRLLFDSFVRAKLQRMFEYRHNTTRRMVESQSWRDMTTTMPSHVAV